MPGLSNCPSDRRNCGSVTACCDSLWHLILLEPKLAQPVSHPPASSSPYNRFTFPAIETDAITYLGLRSPAVHARLAEREAYSPPADLLD